MNSKEMVYSAVALVIGLLLGAVLVGMAAGGGLSEDEVRDIVASENAELEGTLLASLAQDTPTDRVFQTRDLSEAAFLLVTMEQTGEYLSGNDDVEVGDEVREALEAAGGIESTEALELYFDEQVNSVDGVLANVYSALASDLGQEAEVEVCLGLDNDPYSISGPQIYLYLQVPQDDVEELPKEWELLDGPREESMLWSADCYDPEAVQSEDAA